MPDLYACAACGRLQSYPRPVCRCGSTGAVPCTLPVDVEIYSHTEVLRAPTPALQAEVPYTAVLVRGRSGGLLLLPWHGPRAPVIGAAAHVRQTGGALVAAPIEDPA